MQGRFGHRIDGRIDRIWPNKVGTSQPNTGWMKTLGMGEKMACRAFQFMERRQRGDALRPTVTCAINDRQ